MTSNQDQQQRDEQDDKVLRGCLAGLMMAFTSIRGVLLLIAGIIWLLKWLAGE